MPFGKKWDITRTHEIDFDDIYEHGIKPALSSFDVDFIRADEERSGGIIHLTMFERLLLAEVAIVDVTNQNANVFYELGVRHAARPRSTIIIRANEGALPFDIALIRAVSYQLDAGTLTSDGAKNLNDAIAERMKYALEELESKDSPLFQLIPKFPGISLPHEVTESFRDRARYVDGIRQRLDAAKRSGNHDAALDEVEKVERDLGDISEAINAEVVVDVVLAYRDLSAWDKMIGLFERLPRGLAETITLREQYAFALNRRNANGDRQKATEVLCAIVATQGDSPETCGLLGRVYKDMYLDAKSAGGDAKASGALDQAIEWYRRGFTADPRDYYPGVNLATLLTLKNTKESNEERTRILPAVSFAVARLGGIQSQDYWQIATVLEVAVLGNDWDTANRALSRLLTVQHANWNIETTINNLSLIAGAQPDGIDSDRLNALIGELRAALT
jgi:tetratricopeptide (TPR) repeat protein